MESVKQILSNYKGSLKTVKLVVDEIKNRWPNLVDAYDPYSNCLPYKKWKELGFKVKRGEHSIRSLTYIEKKNELGEIIGTFPRTCHLFYFPQVEPIIN